MNIVNDNNTNYMSKYSLCAEPNTLILDKQIFSMCFLATSGLQNSENTKPKNMDIRIPDCVTPHSPPDFI